MFWEDKLHYIIPVASHRYNDLSLCDGNDYVTMYVDNTSSSNSISTEDNITENFIFNDVMN